MIVLVALATELFLSGCSKKDQESNRTSRNDTVLIAQSVEDEPSEREMNVCHTSEEHTVRGHCVESC